MRQCRRERHGRNNKGKRGILMDIGIALLIFGFYAGVIVYSFKLHANKNANTKSKDSDLGDVSPNEG